MAKFHWVNFLSYPWRASKFHVNPLKVCKIKNAMHIFTGIFKIPLKVWKVTLKIHSWFSKTPSERASFGCLQRQFGYCKLYRGVSVNFSYFSGAWFAIYTQYLKAYIIEEFYQTTLEQKSSRIQFQFLSITSTYN